MGRLDDKVAIVTGAARGIGAATAEMFASEGARVILADKRDDLGAQVAARINSGTPGSACYVSLDVTSEENWSDAVAQAHSAFGGIDILVNNAGIIRVKPLVDCDGETFRKVLDTNLVGPYLGIRAVVGAMELRGGGSIINFSSAQGFEGRFGMPAYTASKFGIRGLTKTAAIELGPKGIRVNTVAPGPTVTEMTQRPGWSQEDYNAAYSLYPLGRMAGAEEIAAMCLFLASAESSFVTGADFVADGGVTAGKPRDT
ncbi:SDR family NAD(P)-dependent oxidoreductase [Rhodococcus globerulus]|uniref:SDR family NAD(P)-dependent oxidoreductase n=1 Tax=Rhodococcus globerulus TaxID=33008 RepID=UPI003AFA176B